MGSTPTFAATKGDIDALTSYAVILGRGVACGVNIKPEMQRSAFGWIGDFRLTLRISKPFCPSSFRAFSTTPSYRRMETLQIPAPRCVNGTKEFAGHKIQRLPFSPRS